MRTHQLHREAHPELARQLFALVVKHLHIKQAHEVVDVELFVSTIGHHIRHIRFSVDPRPRRLSNISYVLPSPTTFTWNLHEDTNQTRELMMPVCVAPMAAPEPASTDLAVTSGSVLLIILLIVSLWFLLRPRFEEKTPVASVDLPPGQRSTDGSAPRVDQTARPTGADPTGAPPSCKSEETGSADSPTAECVTSALALTQRVRDLGLHLGDIVVTGLSIGLPNALTGRPVFDEANLSLLMRGDNLIGPLPGDMLQAQLDRNVVQVHKAADGTRVRKPLNMVEDVIKLASRIGQFDLVSEYGLSPAIVETLDTTYALAVAAGLEVRKLNRLRAMLRDCCLRH